jgi:anti-sigma regulatory factor (Ser/Thr protein kinase)
VAVLHEWGLVELAETAELLVSELVTNAIQADRPATVASPYGPQQDLAVISLRLLSDGNCVVIEVGDSNPEPPTSSQAGLDDEGGRGLMLVEALSTRWGWQPATERYGKVVWVELRAHEA